MGGAWKEWGITDVTSELHQEARHCIPITAADVASLNERHTVPPSATFITSYPTFFSPAITT